MKIHVSHHALKPWTVVVGPQFQLMLERLTEQFDADEVVETQPGASTEELETAVLDSDVIVLLLDNWWLEQSLVSKTVAARVELETAFENGIPVIVVLLDPATLPERSVLPEPLSPLLECAAFPVDVFRLELEGLFAAIAQSADRGAAAESEALVLGSPAAASGGLDDTLFEAHAGAPRDEAVQFSVFKPRRVPADRWTKLLAYIHLAGNAPGASDDEPEPIQQAIADAGRRLGEEAPRPQTADASMEIPRETEIRFVPWVEDVRMNPGERTFEWAEDLVFHGEEFEARPTIEVVGEMHRRGSLQVFMGALLIADIPLTLTLVPDAPAAVTGATERVSAAPYRKVFACYSRRDLPIVEHVEAVAAVLGNEFLRDLTTIRVGEQWSDRIEEMIEEAEVFQLFWSSNAKASSFVRREYLHAHGLARPRFVFPTFWEDPCPEPPTELAGIQFKRLVLGSAASDAGGPPPATEPAALPPEETRGGTRIGAAPRDRTGSGESDQAMRPTLSKSAQELLAELGRIGASRPSGTSDRAMLPSASPGPIHVGGGRESPRSTGFGASGGRRPIPVSYDSAPAGEGGGLAAAVGCLFVLAVIAAAVWLIFF